MYFVAEADHYWNELVKRAPYVNLNLSCDAPCNAGFASLATSLCSMGLESPFDEGSDADTEWYDAMYFYRAWRDYDGTSHCAYRKRMIKAAQTMILHNPESPFADPVLSLERLRENEIKRTEAEDIASETYEPVAVPDGAEEEAEAEYREMNGYGDPEATETVVNDPPAKFFNIFRKNRGRKERKRGATK